MDLNSVDPRKIVFGGPARFVGREPRMHASLNGERREADQRPKQSIGPAHHRMASQITIDHIMIENVKEFRGWGPPGANGRTLKRRKGGTYLVFLNSIRSLGYAVEDQVLNVADFDDLTSRERLFI